MAPTWLTLDLLYVCQLRDMLDGVLVLNVSDIVHTLANSTQASEQLSQGDVTLTVYVMQQVIDTIKLDQGLDGGQLQVRTNSAFVKDYSVIF